MRLKLLILIAVGIFLIVAVGSALNKVYGETSCLTSKLYEAWQLNRVIECLQGRITALEQAGGGGENTTAINLGSVGEGVFSSEVMDELQFKKLLAGSGISMSANGTRITITATAGGGNATVLNDLGDVVIITPSTGQILEYSSGAFRNVNHVIFENNTASNLGSSSSLSEPVFAQKSGVDLQFKRLLEGTGILLSSNGTHITITNTVIDTDTDTDDLIGQEVGEVYADLGKTNIGTSYVDIYTSTFHEEQLMLIDFRNGTYARIISLWDYVGTGTQSLRWVNFTNNAQVLFEFSTTIDCGVLNSACDSGWFVIPSWAQATTCDNTSGTPSQCFIEWQAKSTVGTDDPVAKGYKIMVK